MKMLWIGFCLLASTAVFGQTVSVLPNQPAPIAMYEHPQHAATHALRPEENLWGDSAYSYGQGEQPLSDFGTAKAEVPLGDVARELRKSHAADRKATTVYTSD
jgi:hypothetical protein